MQSWEYVLKCVIVLAWESGLDQYNLKDQLWKELFQTIWKIQDDLWKFEVMVHPKIKITNKSKLRIYLSVHILNVIFKKVFKNIFFFYLNYS